MSSTDAHGGECTPLSWGKSRGEVEVTDAAGAGDDLAGGVVPLGPQPDVLRMPTHEARSCGDPAAALEMASDLHGIGDHSHALASTR